MSFRHRYGTNPGLFEPRTRHIKKKIIDKNERSQTHTNINSNRYVVKLKLYDMRRGEIFNLTAK